MDEEYELDELGNPILDELDNPIPKKKVEVDELGNPVDVQPTGINQYEKISQALQSPSTSPMEGFGKAVVRGLYDAGRTVFSRTVDTAPQSLAQFGEFAKTSIDTPASVEEFVRTRKPVDFQEYVREKENIPWYSGFGEKGFQTYLPKYAEQFMREKGYADVIPRIQANKENVINRRLGVEQYVQQQKRESDYKLAGATKGLQDIKSPSDVASLIGSFGGEAIYQIPIAALSRGSSSFVQEAATIYDTQLDNLAKDNGISREEVIKRNLDNPAAGQAYALLAAGLDAASAGKAVSALKSKGGAAVKEWLKSAGTEAVTEPAQGIAETIGAGRGSNETIGESLEKAVLTEEGLLARANEAVGGFIGAGVVKSASNRFGANIDQEINETASTGDPEIDAEIDAVTNDVASAVANAPTTNVTPQSNNQDTNIRLQPDKSESNIRVEPDVQETQAFTESEQPVEREKTLGEQIIEADEQVAQEQSTEPEVQQEITPVDPIQAAEEFNKSGFLTGAGKEAVTQIADYARDKFNKKSQFFSFVENFNEQSERKISDKEADQTWQQIKEVKVREPQETVTMTINEALKKQIKDFYRGVDKGVKKGQELVNTNLIPKVQEALKTSNLTPSQTNAILGKLRRTNLFTPGSYSKLQSYIDNVVAKADYAEKVEQAEALRTQIKQKVKSKEIPANIKNAAIAFTKLDPDQYFENNSVEDYTDLADRIISGTSTTKGNRYSALKVQDVKNKLETEYARQEKEQLRKNVGDLTDEEVDAIIDQQDSLDNYLQNAQGARKVEIMDKLQAKAKYAQIGLQDFQSEDSLETANAKYLAEVDLSGLTADGLAHFIRVADNITLNGDFSNTRRLMYKLKARDASDRLKTILGNLKLKELWATDEVVYSVPLLLDTITNNNTAAADFKAESGLAGVFEAGSTVNNLAHDKTANLDEELNKINKKYKNKPDVRKQEEQWKVVILSALARNSDGSSHIPKIIRNLRQSVEQYKVKKKSFGITVEKYLNEYVGVDNNKITSSEQAIEMFKSKDPQIYDVWKWGQDNIFTKEYTVEASRYAKELYNKEIATDENYSVQPIRTFDRSLPSPDEDAKFFEVGINNVEASAVKTATRSLSPGQAYDTNILQGWLNSYRATKYATKSADSIGLLSEITKRPEFASLIGGQENKAKLVATISKRLKEQRGVNEPQNAAVRAFEQVFGVAKDIGTALALGRVDQIVQQVGSGWVGASIMLGNDASLMFTPNSENFTKEVINQSTLAEANKRFASTDLGDSADLGISDNYDDTVNNILKSVRRKTQWASHMRLVFLRKGDVFLRQQAFKAFYIQRLKQLGVTDINLDTEGSKKTDPNRVKAKAYADNMVAKMQNPTNITEMNDIARARGFGGIMRSVLLPFSGFPLNTKGRYIRAFSKMALSDSKGEGSRELMAVSAETFMFGVIKAIIAVTYYKLLEEIWRKLFDVEEPEKEGGAEETKALRKLITNAISDTPLVMLGAGQKYNIQAYNQLMYQYKKATDPEFSNVETFGEYKEKSNLWLNEPYESDFTDLGVMGVAVDKLDRMIDATSNSMRVTFDGEDTILTDGFYGEKDEYVGGMKDMVQFNALMEYMTLVPFVYSEAGQTWSKVYKEQVKDYTPSERRRSRLNREYNRD